MYELKAGLVKSRVLGSTFEEKDLSSYKVKKLLTDYYEAYLVLTHFAITGETTLRIKDVERMIVILDSDPTVLEWLTMIGNTSLPVVNGLPKVSRKSVLARDVWQAGFTATLCVSKGNPNNDATDADKDDIWLTRKDTDYLASQPHSLTTINGLLHRLDGDMHGLYIKDGGITFRRSNQALLGMFSFESVGNITTHTITADMIYHPSPSGKLSDSSYIKLPFDASGKVVGVSIGGYLHLVSNDIQLTGDRSLKILMNRIPYFERYMVARKLIDMSSMERFHTVNEDPVLYDTVGFNSDECIKELLTLSQSFLIEVDTPNMSVVHIKTVNTGLPGRFYHHEQPNYPLRTQLGLLPSYVKQEEDGVWVLCIDNNLAQHRTLNTFDNTDRPISTEGRVSDWSQSYHRGDLTRWSTESVEVVKPK